MTKILLTGGAGMGNLGDEALVLSVVQKLRARDPGVEITVATPNPGITSWTMPDVNTVSSPRTAFFGAGRGGRYDYPDPLFVDHWKRLAASGQDLWRLAEHTPTRPRLLDRLLRKLKIREPLFFDGEGARAFLTALQDSDAVIVYGGGILTSATSSRLWEMALITRLCDLSGTPILFRSHQVGPITDEQDAERLREIARIATFFGVRDVNVSALEYQRVTGNSPVEAIDDAFFATLPATTSRTLPERYIAVGYRKIRDEPERFSADFVELLSRASTRLKMPVVFVPQGEFDLPDLRLLQTRLGQDSMVLEIEGMTWEPAKVLANAALAITLPHHSVIFALKENVPIISPVCGDYYAAKNKGSMRNLDMDRYVVVYDENPDDFLERCTTLLEEVSTDLEGIRDNLARARTEFFARGKAFDDQFFTQIWPDRPLEPSDAP